MQYKRIEVNVVYETNKQDEDVFTYHYGNPEFERLRIKAVELLNRNKNKILTEKEFLSGVVVTNKSIRNNINDEPKPGTFSEKDMEDAIVADPESSLVKSV